MTANSLEDEHRVFQECSSKSPYTADPYWRAGRRAMSYPFARARHNIESPSPRMRSEKEARKTMRRHETRAPPFLQPRHAFHSTCRRNPDSLPCPIIDSIKAWKQVGISCIQVTAACMSIAQVGRPRSYWSMKRVSPTLHRPQQLASNELYSKLNRGHLTRRVPWRVRRMDRSCPPQASQPRHVWADQAPRHARYGGPWSNCRSHGSTIFFGSPIAAFVTASQASHVARRSA
jgi:hypothetical protein